MKRGFSSVVAPILIILVIVVGSAIFLSVYLRSVRDVANRDLPLCAGIDLDLIWCIAFPAGYSLPGGIPLDQHAVYFVVERKQGGGEIRDLRFKLTETNGRDHSERPVNITAVGVRILAEYSGFVEHATTEAAVKPINYAPKYARVTAVVGESNTVCPIVDEPIRCVLPDLTEIP